MLKLSAKEKKELKELVKSRRLREDLRKISENRYDPFRLNGSIDLDRLLIFLTEYNDFISHTPKPFRKIINNINVL